ncbi:MAG: hypothetical protein NTW19_01050 [Planctomycetota bacterium]|nr:hypothetical protein [Planctomycetota bacterium]
MTQPSAQLAALCAALLALASSPGCANGPLPISIAKPDTVRHSLPLYVMETFHARLKERCEEKWVGCEFQGGLTATPEFRLEIPDTLWYWEVYEYTFARPAEPGHEEYTKPQHVRQRGIKLAAVINLDDPSDNYSKPFTLQIAGRKLTLWVGGLTYVMPPHQLRASPLSIEQLMISLDDRHWSLKTYSEQLAPQPVPVPVPVPGVEEKAGEEQGEKGKPAETRKAS